MIQADGETNHLHECSHLPSKAEETGSNRLDPVELESFCITKETIDRARGQSAEWEEIVPNDPADEGLAS